MRQYLAISFIGLLLFIIPFFWLSPGELNIGGDSTLLYFYDPFSFLQNTAFYSMVAQGIGGVQPSYYYLPYVGTIALLNNLFPSWVVAASINGLKLSLGFLSIFVIVKELLGNFSRKDTQVTFFASFLAAIFYVVSFGSYHMAYFWDRAITSHNQIFVNPVMFLLLLKFIDTKKYYYLWSAIIFSVIFSPNFSLTSAPPFFAFFPIVLLFLLIYARLFLVRYLPWRGIGLGVLLFIGVQSFQLFPQIMSLFDPGSFSNTRVFDEKSILHDVEYFVAVSQNAKVALNILLPSAKDTFYIFSIISSVIVVFGLLINRDKNKQILFVSLFFLLTLFLSTAHITDIGFKMYTYLFYFPGVSMFRNFYTQWMFIFIFFYSLLIGFSLRNVFMILNKKNRLFAWLALLLLFIIPGIPLFLGTPVNDSEIRRSQSVKTSIVMDPRYEEVLSYLRALPADGKILVLPLSDAYYQVVAGNNGGVYEGPSTLTHLAGRYGFVGYQDFYPYPEDIMKYSREKDYAKLLRIFNTLNIKYILHNSDPAIYEKGLQPGPYEYMLTSMPKSQADYEEYISHFPVSVLYKNGPYIIYKLDESVYNSTVFIPDGIYSSDVLSFDNTISFHSAFLQRSICNTEQFASLCNGEYASPQGKLTVRELNPVIYEVSFAAEKPIEYLVIVLQHRFHTGWKIIMDGKELKDIPHVPINGYANAWIINSSKLHDQNNISFLIRLDDQKYFYYGLYASLTCFIVVLALLVISIAHEGNKKQI